MKKKIDFNGVLTEVFQTTHLPKWQTKQQVPPEREGRMVVHIEARDLFKEIAKRNKTNMATAIWLAGYHFWKGLGYSREDYDKIVAGDL